MLHEYVASDAVLPEKRLAPIGDTNQTRTPRKVFWVMNLISPNNGGSASLGLFSDEVEKQHPMEQNLLLEQNRGIRQLQHIRGWCKLLHLRQPELFIHLNHALCMIL